MRSGNYVVAYSIIALKPHYEFELRQAALNIDSEIICERYLILAEIFFKI